MPAYGLGTRLFVCCLWLACRTRGASAARDRRVGAHCGGVCSEKDRNPPCWPKHPCFARGWGVFRLQKPPRLPGARSLPAVFFPVMGVAASEGSQSTVVLAKQIGLGPSLAFRVTRAGRFDALRPSLALGDGRSYGSVRLRMPGFSSSARFSISLDRDNRADGALGNPTRRHVSLEVSTGHPHIRSEARERRPCVLPGCRAGLPVLSRARPMSPLPAWPGRW